MDKDSEIIYQRILALQIKINLLKYQKDDVRSYFFDLLRGIILGYNKGYLFLEISEKTSSNFIIQKELDFSPNQLNLFDHTISKEYSRRNYLSYHHRNLIISSWSCFELLITTLCDFLLPANTKNELLSFEFDEIKKKLMIDETPELKEKFSRKHLTHVPIARKYNKIFDMITDAYERDLKKDRRFLGFLGDLRNTMHTNFIYFGTDNKKYTFNSIEFLFNQNEVVKYNDPSPLSPILYLNLVDELTAISLEIINKVNYEDLISYPDLKAQL